MTVNEIRQLDDDFLSAEAAAEALHMSADRLREYARTGRLPFSARISGNRVTVSRISLLNWIDGKQDPGETPGMERLMKELISEIHTQNVLLAQLFNRLSAETEGVEIR